MFPQRPELRVVIRKLGTRYFAITTQDTGLEICTNEFQHDPVELARSHPSWVLQRGICSSDAARPLDDATGEIPVVSYGQHLYSYLFGDGQRLRRYLGANIEYQQARLTLSLHPDAASLWQLPWEYLHDGNSFTCLDGNMVLARVPAGLPVLSPPMTPPPLRILLIIATPDDQPALDVERELAVVQDALEDIIRMGNLSMAVLEEATLPALKDVLTREKYDILHYIGHGTFRQNPQQGFLCFENRVGQTELVGAQQLEPLLSTAPTLRMMVIAACQSAQIDVRNAFENVATGLLQANLPAVVTVPTNLPDEAATVLSHTLYDQLTRGVPPGEALHHVRIALKNADDERAPDEQRFDWAVPALYLRAPAMRLLDHDLTLEIPTLLRRKDRTTAELSLPAVFVNRVKELHTLRAALQEHIPAIYLWGETGAGKSSLTAKLIEYAGISLDNVLVIHCRQLLEPALALERIARFWRAHQTQAHLEAADLLLNAGSNTTERAQTAQQMLETQPYLIVFDDIDAWFDARIDPRDPTPARIANTAMRAVLRGLLSAQTATTFMFTAQSRWAEIDALPAGAKQEVHLDDLTERQAVQMMQSLRYLERETPVIKQEIYRLVGGRPEVLTLLDGWIAAGNPLKTILINPPVARRVTAAWQQHLLRDILNSFDASENQALMSMAVLKGAFSAGLVTKIAGIAVKYAVPLVKRWEKCSLLQFHHLDDAKDPWYTLHPVVSEYILARLDRNDRREFHAQAATYFGAPFVDEARRRVVARNLTTWSGEQIHWLARDTNGILGMWVRQMQNPEHARNSLKRALSWQYHLFHAGEFEAAAQIVSTIVPVLKRWGLFTLAETLLQRNAAMANAPNRATSLDALGTLYVEHGHLNEALKVYEGIYRMLEAQGAQSQMAHILSRIAGIYAQRGDYDNAIKLGEVALRRLRDLEDEAGQSRTLHLLTSIYRQIEDHQKALVYGQAAKELDDRRGDAVGAATIVYEQGLILKQMERNDNALECFKRSVHVACKANDEALIANNVRELNAVSQTPAQLEIATGILVDVLEAHPHLRARDRVYVLETLHDLYVKQGDIEKATITDARMLHLKQRLEQESE